MDIALNWLTQGVIVAMAAAAGLRVIPRSRTQARYGFVCVALLLVAVLPALPLVFAAAIDTSAANTAPVPAEAVVTMPVAWWSSSATAISLWSIWLAIQAVQFVVGVIRVRHARRQSRECPADVLAQLPHFSHVSATGRATRVVLSERVLLAAVLGCGTPVIALAPRVLTRLGVADLDRVLTHEWAHVQRRDDVAQLVQQVVRIIVGWHPAAWWLDRQLEFEREVACDELAVRVTGSVKGYATCLATLASLPPAPLPPLPALAVSSSRLRRRVVRILAASSAGMARPWRAVAAGGGVGLLALALVVSDLTIVTSAVAVTSTSISTVAHFVSDAAHVANPDLTQPAPAVAAQTDPRARRTRESRKTVSAASAASEVSDDVNDTRAPEEPVTTSAASLPLPSSDWPLDATIATPVAALASEPAVNEVPEPGAAEKPATPWSLAADGGVAIGRASRNAGVATAGFFSRFGKKIARSF